MGQDLENILVNELSKAIDKEIIERLMKLSNIRKDKIFKIKEKLGII